ncbi:MAG: response regulator [Planctomycetes bacterium]|nr:response regulator [Planctomycetota bacterium]
MTRKILCVDDEPNVLAGIERNLRKQFEIETAAGGEQGLQAVAARGPFAVIVSDMRMPGMSGVDFLSRVRPLAPDSVRVMLTGNTDQQTAIDAVNSGSIFRFLTKPCPNEVLAQTLKACLEQYQLNRLEKDLLEQTLHKSVKVLTEVLALANPVAFGRATRVQRLVRALVERLKVADGWQVEVAAMLSQIGCVTVPEGVLDKIYTGKELTADEAGMFARHPEIGGKLIAQIPRLETVGQIVACQESRFSTDASADAAVRLGTRILKAALDFDSLESSGRSKPAALELLKGRTGWYDPTVLLTLETIARLETVYERRVLAVGELVTGMILDDCVFLVSGATLVSKGQELTDALLCRLHNFAAQKKIKEPIAVLMPV